MYSVYIVDDEPLMLESIAARKEFLECNFTVVGKHTNPYLAIEEIGKLKPHVVVTDLKMPEISGVQLMETLQLSGIGTQFVMLSSYMDFASVRRFFLSHGFDYLLKPVSSADLTEMLQRMLIKLEFSEPVKEVKTNSRELNEIMAYLQQYFIMNHTLESLSEKFNINPTYICQLFSKHLNTTFISYLTDLRMEKASALLLKTDKTIKEIAVLSGYNDYFYFCRVFKEHFNVPPSKFRKAALANENPKG